MKINKTVIDVLAVFGVIFVITLFIGATLVPGLKDSEYPRTNQAPARAIFRIAVTNGDGTGTNMGIFVEDLLFQATNGLSGGSGDAGGTNSRQGGSLILTNWSGLPTGAMANVVATTFLTNWSDAISNYVTAATNAAQVTNWITSRQPADTDLTNWASIPTGAMANVVSTTFLTNWANAVSNYVTAATNAPSVTNWINFRQPADTDLTNWSNIPTGEIANVVSTTFLTNWADAISNLHNRRSIFTQGVSVVTTATNWNFINGSNASISAVNVSGNVSLTFNVPTDFTNVYYVNPDSNLSSILTNAPNNSTIRLGQGNWTNAVSRQFSNNVLGMFHLQNKTNITIQGFGRATIVTTNEGDHMVISNCSNIKLLGINFRGVKTTNADAQALYGAVILAASREIEIANCDFSEIGDHGIIDHIGLAGGFQSTNVYVHDNRFFWVGGWHSAVLGYDGAGVVCGSYWRVWRNRFLECQQPIEFFGSFDAREVVHVSIQDNYLENPTKAGIYDNGQTNNYWQKITGNLIIFDDSKRTVSSNGLASADGIVLAVGRGVLIEGNTIMGAPQAAVNFLSNIDTWQSWGNRVAGNTFSNNQFDVVVGTGIKRGFTIEGNRSFRSRLPYLIAGSHHVIQDNYIEDAVSGGQPSAIYVGASRPATNVQVLNNRIVSTVGYSPGGAGIVFDTDVVNSRLFGNQVQSTYSPRIIDNSMTPQPTFWIDMVPGISTNPFVIYNTNNAPVFSVDSRGFLLITNSLTNRVAAPTNTIAIGADNFGGMNLPNWTDHNGLQSALQPFLGHEQVYWLGTGNGAIGTDEGVLSATNGGTTISHPAPVESQMFMQQLDTVATSNSCATRFSAVDLANAGAHNGSSKIGGYFYVATWCSTNLIAQVEGGGAPRTFVGMTTLGIEAYTNMVVTTNATAQYVGLMVDTKQSTNMFLTARDASAEFRTNTGLPFIATNVYKFYLFNAPTSRFVNWRLDDAYSGASRSGWFSNNVPTNFMKFGIATKNGTNRAHSVRYSRIYLQAPLVPPR